MRKKRLGILSTVIWDVIHRRGPVQSTIEEWGGATYALAALDAALPDNWEIVPLIKVGEDLAPEARKFFRTLRRIAPDTSVIEVPYSNPRVVLHYRGGTLHSEYLRGGVPSWHWLGLKPLLTELDALHINMIVGNEIDLEVAQLIRQNYAGPIYCDLHSLLLDTSPEGLRTPRTIPNVAEWLRCFDFIQVNEREMQLLAPDAMALAATAMAGGASVLNVTLGERGAAYFAAPTFEQLSDITRQSMVAASALDGPIRSARVPAAPLETTDDEIDPTGCGDVFGATYFARMVAGDTLGDAIRQAMRAASKNATFRGASSLAPYLRGELSTT